MAKILIVDDDELLTGIVGDFLRQKKHEIDCSADGFAGSEKLLGGSYDLAVLDWQLPKKSGIDICSGARKQGLALPILMFTSRGQPADVVLGLDVGADDYLIKPFELEEFGARIAALLRRPRKVTDNTLICGDIAMSLGCATISRAGESVELTPIEYSLLEFLMRNPGKVFAAEELLDRVWTTDSEGSYAAVAACISRLRVKLAVDGKKSIIKTVHGSGYKLEE